MKIADIETEKTYLTRVSGALVRVVAVSRIEPDGRWNKQTRFRVRRVDNGRVLDKSRTAGALRPLPAPPPAPDPASQPLVAAYRVAKQLDAEHRWSEAAAAWATLAEDAAAAGRPKLTATANYHAARAKIESASTDPETAK